MGSGGGRAAERSLPASRKSDHGQNSHVNKTWKWGSEDLDSKQEVRKGEPLEAIADK